MSMTTLSDFSALVGGQLHGNDTDFASVSTDTRTLKEGALFFALRGPRFNAAEFVGQAAEKGAAGAVVEELTDLDLSQVEVRDARVALGDFSCEWRKRWGRPLIGVTGSNGKTTTKELTAGMCGAAFGEGAVLATAGNLNNDIGLPLTLLRLRDQHQLAVAEMGANHPGEIALLSGISAPNIAVITNVARAHIEGFGSVEAVAETKGEILDGLGAEGTAVLNRDDQFFDQWCERAGDARVVSFGLSAEADCGVENVQPVVRQGRPGFAFDLLSPAGKVAVMMPLAGRHNVLNALAAAAAAMAAGAELSHVSAGLAQAHNVPGRLRVFRSNSGAMIFDDSYNANPESVAAAIAALAECRGEAWLVLGDMAELGDDEIEMHRATGRLARESGADALLCIGELGKEIGSGFGPGARWFESMGELEGALREELVPGRNVLIKGSRCMGMDRLVQALEVGGAE